MNSSSGILFTYACAAFAISLVATAIALLFKNRYLIVKPTFMAGLTGITGACSTAIYSRQIHASLLNPWDYLFATQLTSLLLLLLSTISVDRTAKSLWNSIANVPPGRYLELRLLIPALSVVSAFCLALYFVFVPPWKTGLWIALQHGDALMSRDAREESLKLLPTLPRYVFAFNRDVVTRLFAVVITVFGIGQWTVTKKRTYFLIPAVIAALAISASIYGARGPGGMVIASAFLAWYLFKGVPLKVSYVVPGILLILLVPTLISVIRVGADLSLERVWRELSNTILRRVFFTGIETSLWHIDYVQHHGFWGISSIPKLAVLFGVTPVNVDNLIMNEYFKSTSTGLATVGSHVTNYTRFGLIGGISLSVCCYLMMDYLLVMTSKLNELLLLPTVTVLLVMTKASLGSNLETVFITKGLIPGMLLIWILNKILIRRLPRVSGGARTVQHATL